LSQKIVLSETSPPPLTQDNDEINGGNVSVSSKNKKGLYGVVNKLTKKVLQILSNLPLAIGEMFIIAFLMGLGMCSSFLVFSISESQL
jgi:cytochrome c biogenesis protein